MKKRSIFYMGSCLLPTIATTPVCLLSIQPAGVPLDRPPLHARQPLLSDLSRHSSTLEPRLRHHFEFDVRECLLICSRCQLTEIVEEVWKAETSGWQKEKEKAAKFTFFLLHCTDVWTSEQRQQQAIVREVCGYAGCTLADIWTEHRGRTRAGKKSFPILGRGNSGQIRPRSRLVCTQHQLEIRLTMMMLLTFSSREEDSGKWIAGDRRTVSYW